MILIYVKKYLHDNFVSFHYIYGNTEQMWTSQLFNSYLSIHFFYKKIPKDNRTCRHTLNIFWNSLTFCLSPIAKSFFINLKNKSWVPIWEANNFIYLFIDLNFHILTHSIAGNFSTLLHHKNFLKFFCWINWLITAV